MTWQIVPCGHFSEHAAAWDALHSASGKLPFLASGFIAPLLTEFGSGNEVLAFHHTAQGVDAATILQPVGKGMWQSFQPSQLPLGPWLTTQPQADLGSRLQSLVKVLPGFALGVGVTQLDPRLQQRPRDGANLQTLDYISTSYIDIHGSFDDYWEARGKNLRQNTRKQRNKLNSEGVTPQLECITDAAGVEAALQDYGRLESAGWKAGLGTAIAPDNAQGRFYLAMLRHFCGLGRGCIYRYRFGEQVVAMDLCIDNGTTVVILKTAYDESLRTVSPSTLMRQEQFAQWWAQGHYQRIEFYGKTLEWHTRWADQACTLYHSTAFRWALLRTLRERIAQRKNVAPAEQPAAVDKAA